MSQYADYFSFYLKDESSIQRVLRYFKNYHKAIGAKINIEKSIILPINNNQINTLKQNLKNIQRSISTNTNIRYFLL